MSGMRAGRHRTEPTATLVAPVDPTRDHTQGRADAPVTLVEYGDYQCPYCGAAYPIVKRIQATVGEPLRFVFRNFPLTEGHQHAEFAAELAESVGSHGKFWEMHDFLYEHQSSLGQPEVFLRFAQDHLKLDPKAIHRELDQHTFRRRVEEDFMSGARSGVNGTPTFYINGARHDGSYEYDELLDAIRRLVNRPQVRDGAGG